MQLLDGRKVSKELLKKIADEVALIKKTGDALRLAFIIVGNNPASESYVKQKKIACETVGIEEEMIRLEENSTTDDLLKLIAELNERKDITGFIVQLPLPKHIETPKVIRAIDPKKDLDGFQAYNLGKMFLNKEYEHLAPCTPRGIIKLLEYYDIPLKGKDVCIIGASNIAGKPLAMMMLNREATVSICHIATKNIKFYSQNADMVVSAVGRPKLITADLIKNGAIVIDVGINRDKDGKMCGDSDFENIKDKCSYITPVPGGVGPMTVASLMENIITAYKRQKNIL